MLNEYFERDSFTLKHWDNWGYRVTSDKLGILHSVFYGLYYSNSEDDFDGTLKKIIDRVWEPQSEFQKLNSVYMEWYRTTKEEFEEKKKGKKLILDYITEKHLKNEGKFANF